MYDEIEDCLDSNLGDFLSFCTWASPARGELINSWFSGVGTSSTVEDNEDEDELEDPEDW